MRIQHNIMAMNAYRNYPISKSMPLAKSTLLVVTPASVAKTLRSSRHPALITLPRAA